MPDLLDVFTKLLDAKMDRLSARGGGRLAVMSGQALWRAWARGLTGIISSIPHYMQAELVIPFFTLQSEILSSEK